MWKKTIQLENILKQANIDKTKFDQLKQIEISYNELREKYHIAEQLEEQLTPQNDLYEKLKIAYDNPYLNLLKRDENIRLLKLEIKDHEQLIDKYHKQINNFQNEFEKQKKPFLIKSRSIAFINIKTTRWKKIFN